MTLPQVHRNKCGFANRKGGGSPLRLCPFTWSFSVPAARTWLLQGPFFSLLLSAPWRWHRGSTGCWAFVCWEARGLKPRRAAGPGCGGLPTPRPAHPPDSSPSPLSSAPPGFRDSSFLSSTQQLLKVRRASRRSCSVQPLRRAAALEFFSVLPRIFYVLSYHQ